MELYGRAGTNSRSDPAGELFGNEFVPHEPNRGPEPGAAEHHRLQRGVEAVSELGTHSNFYERRERELRRIAVGAKPAVPWWFDATGESRVGAQPRQCWRRCSDGVLAGNCLRNAGGKPL